MDCDRRRAELCRERAHIEVAQHRSVLTENFRSSHHLPLQPDGVVEGDRTQRQHRVRLHEKPGTDRRKLGRLLENLDVGSLAPQGDRQREAADAGAGDEDLAVDGRGLGRGSSRVCQSTSVSR